MPSLDRKLAAYRKKIEDNFSVIFAEIERYLLTGEQDWSGKEIPETHQMIQEAKNLAYRDVQNHISSFIFKTTVVGMNSTSNIPIANG